MDGALSQFFLGQPTTPDELRAQIEYHITPLHAEIMRLKKEVELYKQLYMEASEDLGKLQIASEAVIKRWDSPLWKDIPHTGEYINALRRALE